MLFIVLVFVFYFDLFKFSAAILEKGLLCRILFTMGLFKRKFFSAREITPLPGANLGRMVTDFRNKCLPEGSRGMPQ